MVKEFIWFCEIVVLFDGFKWVKKINGSMVLVVYIKGKLYVVFNVCFY